MPGLRSQEERKRLAEYKGDRACLNEADNFLIEVRQGPTSAGLPLVRLFARAVLGAPPRPVSPTMSSACNPRYTTFPTSGPGLCLPFLIYAITTALIYTRHEVCAIRLQLLPLAAELAPKMRLCIAMASLPRRLDVVSKVRLVPPARCSLAAPPTILPRQLIHS